MMLETIQLGSKTSAAACKAQGCILVVANLAPVAWVCATARQES